MINRLKTNLVDSFVGAIALGWVFSQGILHFAYALSAPVGSWLARIEYHGMAGGVAFPANFSFKDAIPELIRSATLLLVGYLLLRWLYYRQSEIKANEADPEQNAQC